VQNDNDLVILEGNDINDELASFDGVEIEMVDSDDESYDPANPNTYEDYFNVMLYIFLYVLICLLLIAGFWTNMVGGWLRRRGRRSRTADEAEQDEA
jgi:hypothetical protein